MNHDLLLQRLQHIGFSDITLKWFLNYLSGRTQCVAVDSSSSDLGEVKMGVPQGVDLGPILFTIYINNLCVGLDSARVHLYADDTVLYTSAPSVKTAVDNLQSAFSILQASLLSLRLALNEKKTKYMVFTRTRSSLPNVEVSTTNGTLLERVKTYKYLGIWLDEKLNYETHIAHLLKKLRPKLSFYFRLKKCFPIAARLRLVQSTFLPILDYGDILYMHASTSLLKKLDVVYHAALRFITNANMRTHHCTLYEMVSWTSLPLRRKIHSLIFIVKALVGKLPSYINCLLSRQTSSFGTRSGNKIMLNIPTVRTVLGKTSFSSYAPYAWNNLQNILNLESVPSIDAFKNLLNTTLVEECHCF